MNSKTLKSIRNFILLILIAWFVKTTILEIYVVPTGSMLDTIEERDLVIGNKFIYGLRTNKLDRCPILKNWFIYT